LNDSAGINLGASVNLNGVKRNEEFNKNFSVKRFEKILWHLHRDVKLQRDRARVVFSCASLCLVELPVLFCSIAHFAPPRPT